MNLISISNLTVAVAQTKIIDDISLNIEEGKILGVVGGSGSGKTTLGLSLLRMLPSAMRVTGGRISFMDRSMTAYSDEEMRQLRGEGIGMVFQEPLSAFDPLFTIGEQLDETLRAHDKGQSPKAVRRQRIIETLQLVEIDDPKRVSRSYPHQLSGGLRQRAMIAQAIVCAPRMIIADEATSSLDVTIQAKIIRLLRKLNKEKGMTILLIAHDLGLVGHLADHIAVMTEGRIVESGSTTTVLQKPQHPYTRSLIEAFA